MTSREDTVPPNSDPSEELGRNFSGLSVANQLNARCMSKASLNRLQLLRIKHDGVPLISRNIVTCILRYIKNTPKRVREEPDFIDGVRKRLLFLYDYKFNFNKHKKKFPYTQQLSALLVRYVTLEYEALYTPRNYNIKYENEVERRIMCLLDYMCHETETENVQPFKTSIRMLRILNQMDDEYKDEEKLVGNMIKKLLNKLGLLEKINKIKNDPTAVADLHRNPDLRLLCIEDDYADSSSGDDYESDEVTEIAAPVEISPAPALEDVKFRLKPIVVKEERTKLKDPVLTIELNDDDDVDMEYFREEVQSVRNDRTKSKEFVKKECADIKKDLKNACIDNLGVHSDKYDSNSTNENFYEAYFRNILENNTLFKSNKECNYTRVLNAWSVPRTPCSTEIVEIKDDEEEEEPKRPVKDENARITGAPVHLNADSILISSDEEDDAEYCREPMRVNFAQLHNSVKTNSTTSKDYGRDTHLLPPQTDSISNRCQPTISAALNSIRSAYADADAGNYKITLRNINELTTQESTSLNQQASNVSKTDITEVVDICAETKLEEEDDSYNEDLLLSEDNDDFLGCKDITDEDQLLLENDLCDDENLHFNATECQLDTSMNRTEHKPSLEEQKELLLDDNAAYINESVPQIETPTKVLNDSTKKAIDTTAGNSNSEHVENLDLTIQADVTHEETPEKELQKNQLEDILRSVKYAVEDYLDVDEEEFSALINDEEKIVEVLLQYVNCEDELQEKFETSRQDVFTDSETILCAYNNDKNLVYEEVVIESQTEEYVESLQHVLEPNEIIVGKEILIDSECEYSHANAILVEVRQDSFTEQNRLTIDDNELLVEGEEVIINDDEQNELPVENKIPEMNEDNHNQMVTVVTNENIGKDTQNDDIVDNDEGKIKDTCPTIEPNDIILEHHEEILINDNITIEGTENEIVVKHNEGNKVLEVAQDALPHVEPNEILLEDNHFLVAEEVLISNTEDEAANDACPVIEPNEFHLEHNNLVVAEEVLVNTKEEKQILQEDNDARLAEQKQSFEVPEITPNLEDNPNVVCILKEQNKEADENRVEISNVEKEESQILEVDKNTYSIDECNLDNNIVVAPVKASEIAINEPQQIEECSSSKGTIPPLQEVQQNLEVCQELIVEETSFVSKTLDNQHAIISTSTDDITTIHPRLHVPENPDFRCTSSNEASKSSVVSASYVAQQQVVIFDPEDSNNLVTSSSHCYVEKNELINEIEISSVTPEDEEKVVYDIPVESVEEIHSTTFEDTPTSLSEDAEEIAHNPLDVTDLLVLADTAIEQEKNEVQCIVTPRKAGRPRKATRKRRKTAVPPATQLKVEKTPVKTRRRRVLNIDNENKRVTRNSKENALKIQEVPKMPVFLDRSYEELPTSDDSNEGKLVIDESKLLADETKLDESIIEPAKVAIDVVVISTTDKVGEEANMVTISIPDDAAQYKCETFNLLDHVETLEITRATDSQDDVPLIEIISKVKPRTNFTGILKDVAKPTTTANHDCVNLELQKTSTDYSIDTILKKCALKEATTDLNLDLNIHVSSEEITKIDNKDPNAFLKYANCMEDEKCELSSFAVKSIDAIKTKAAVKSYEIDSVEYRKCSIRIERTPDEIILNLLKERNSSPERSSNTTNKRAVRRTRSQSSASKIPDENEKIDVTLESSVKENGKLLSVHKLESDTAKDAGAIAPSEPNDETKIVTKTVVEEIEQKLPEFESFKIEKTLKSDVEFNCVLTANKSDVKKENITSSRRKRSPMKLNMKNKQPTKTIAKNVQECDELPKKSISNKVTHDSRELSAGRKANKLPKAIAMNEESNEMKPRKLSNKSRFLENLEITKSYSIEDKEKSQAVSRITRSKEVKVIKEKKPKEEPATKVENKRSQEEADKDVTNNTKKKEKGKNAVEVNISEQPEELKRFKSMKSAESNDIVKTTNELLKKGRKPKNKVSEITQLRSRDESKKAQKTLDFSMIPNDQSKESDISLEKTVSGERSKARKKPETAKDITDHDLFKANKRERESAEKRKSNCLAPPTENDNNEDKSESINKKVSAEKRKSKVSVDSVDVQEVKKEKDKLLIDTDSKNNKPVAEINNKRKSKSSTQLVDKRKSKLLFNLAEEKLESTKKRKSKSVDREINNKDKSPTESIATNNRVLIERRKLNNTDIDEPIREAESTKKKLSAEKGKSKLANFNKDQEEALTQKKEIADKRKSVSENDKLSTAAKKKDTAEGKALNQLRKSKSREINKDIIESLDNVKLGKETSTKRKESEVNLGIVTDIVKPRLTGDANVKREMPMKGDVSLNEEKSIDVKEASAIAIENVELEVCEIPTKENQKELLEIASIPMEATHSSECRKTTLMCEMPIHEETSLNKGNESPVKLEIATSSDVISTNSSARRKPNLTDYSKVCETPNKEDVSLIKGINEKESSDKLDINKEDLSLIKGKPVNQRESSEKLEIAPENVQTNTSECKETKLRDESKVCEITIGKEASPNEQKETNRTESSAKLEITIEKDKLSTVLESTTVFEETKPNLTDDSKVSEMPNEVKENREKSPVTLGIAAEKVKSTDAESEDTSERPKPKLTVDSKVLEMPIKNEVKANRKKSSVTLGIASDKVKSTDAECTNTSERKKTKLTDDSKVCELPTKNEVKENRKKSPVTLGIASDKVKSTDAESTNTSERKNTKLTDDSKVLEKPMKNEVKAIRKKSPVALGICREKVKSTATESTNTSERRKPKSTDVSKICDVPTKMELPLMEEKLTNQTENVERLIDVDLNSVTKVSEMSTKTDKSLESASKKEATKTHVKDPETKLESTDRTESLKTKSDDFTVSKEGSNVKGKSSMERNDLLSTPKDSDTIKSKKDKSPRSFYISDLLAPAQIKTPEKFSEPTVFEIKESKSKVDETNAIVSTEQTQAVAQDAEDLVIGKEESTNEPLEPSKGKVNKITLDATNSSYKDCLKQKGMDRKKFKSAPSDSKELESSKKKFKILDVPERPKLLIKQSQKDLVGVEVKLNKIEERKECNSSSKLKEVEHITTTDLKSSDAVDKEILVCASKLITKRKCAETKDFQSSQDKLLETNINSKAKINIVSDILITNKEILPAKECTIIDLFREYTHKVETKLSCIELSKSTTTEENKMKTYKTRDFFEKFNFIQETKAIMRSNSSKSIGEAFKDEDIEEEAARPKESKMEPLKNDKSKGYKTVDFFKAFVSKKESECIKPQQDRESTNSEITIPIVTNNDLKSLPKPDKRKDSKTIDFFTEFISKKEKPPAKLEHTKPLVETLESKVDTKLSSESKTSNIESKPCDSQSSEGASMEFESTSKSKPLLTKNFQRPDFFKDYLVKETSQTGATKTTEIGKSEQKEENVTNLLVDAAVIEEIGALSYCSEVEVNTSVLYKDISVTDEKVVDKSEDNVTSITTVENEDTAKLNNVEKLQKKARKEDATTLIINEATNLIAKPTKLKNKLEATIDNLKIEGEKAEKNYKTTQNEATMKSKKKLEISADKDKIEVINKNSDNNLISAKCTKESKSFHKEQGSKMNKMVENELNEKQIKRNKSLHKQESSKLRFEVENAVDKSKLDDTKKVKPANNLIATDEIQTKKSKSSSKDVTSKMENVAEKESNATNKAKMDEIKENAKGRLISTAVDASESKKQEKVANKHKIDELNVKVTNNLILAEVAKESPKEKVDASKIKTKSKDAHKATKLMNNPISPVEEDQKFSPKVEISSLKKKSTNVTEKAKIKVSTEADETNAKKQSEKKETSIQKEDIARSKKSKVEDSLISTSVEKKSKLIKKVDTTKLKIPLDNAVGDTKIEKINEKKSKHVDKFEKAESKVKVKTQSDTTTKLISDRVDEEGEKKESNEVKRDGVAEVIKSIQKQANVDTAQFEEQKTQSKSIVGENSKTNQKEKDVKLIVAAEQETIINKSDNSKDHIQESALADLLTEETVESNKKEQIEPKMPSKPVELPTNVNTVNDMNVNESIQQEGSRNSDLKSTTLNAAVLIQETKELYESAKSIVDDVKIQKSKEILCDSATPEQKDRVISDQPKSDLSTFLEVQVDEKLSKNILNKRKSSSEIDCAIKAKKSKQCVVTTKSAPESDKEDSPKKRDKSKSRKSIDFIISSLKNKDVAENAKTRKALKSAIPPSEEILRVESGPSGTIESIIIETSEIVSAKNGEVSLDNSQPEICAINEVEDSSVVMSDVPKAVEKCAENSSVEICDVQEKCATNELAENSLEISSVVMSENESSNCNFVDETIIDDSADMKDVTVKEPLINSLDEKESVSDLMTTQTPSEDTQTDTSINDQKSNVIIVSQVETLQQSNVLEMIVDVPTKEFAIDAEKKEVNSNKIDAEKESKTNDMSTGVTFSSDEVSPEVPSQVLDDEAPAFSSFLENHYHSTPIKEIAKAESIASKVSAVVKESDTPEKPLSTSDSLAPIHLNIPSSTLCINGEQNLNFVSPTSLEINSTQVPITFIQTSSINVMSNRCSDLLSSSEVNLCSSQITSSTENFESDIQEKTVESGENEKLKFFVHIGSETTDHNYYSPGGPLLGFLADNENMFPFSEQACVGTLMDNNVIEVSNTLDDSQVDSATDYQLSEQDSHLNFSFITDNLKQEREDYDDGLAEHDLPEFDPQDFQHKAVDGNTVNSANDFAVSSLLILGGQISTDPSTFPMTNFGLADIDNINFSSAAENNMLLQQAAASIDAVPTVLVTPAAATNKNIEVTAIHTPQKNLTFADMWPETPSKIDLISRPAGSTISVATSKLFPTPNTLQVPNQSAVDTFLSSTPKTPQKKKSDGSSKTKSKEPKREKNLSQLDKYRSRTLTPICLDRIKSDLAGKLEMNSFVVRRNQRTPVSAPKPKPKPPLPAKGDNISNTSQDEKPASSPEMSPQIINETSNLSTISAADSISHISSVDQNKANIADDNTIANKPPENNKRISLKDGKIATKDIRIEVKNGKIVIRDNKKATVGADKVVVSNNAREPPLTAAASTSTAAAAAPIADQQEKINIQAENFSRVDAEPKQDTSSSESSFKFTEEVYENKYDLIKRRQRPTTNKLINNYSIEKLLQVEDKNRRPKSDKPKPPLKTSESEVKARTKRKSPTVDLPATNDSSSSDDASHKRKNWMKRKPKTSKDSNETYSSRIRSSSSDDEDFMSKKPKPPASTDTADVLFDRLLREDSANQQQKAKAQAKPPKEEAKPKEDSKEVDRKRKAPERTSDKPDPAKKRKESFAPGKTQSPHVHPAVSTSPSKYYQTSQDKRRKELGSKIAEFSKQRKDSGTFPERSHHSQPEHDKYRDSRRPNTFDGGWSNAYVSRSGEPRHSGSKPGSSRDYYSRYYEEPNRSHTLQRRMPSSSQPHPSATQLRQDRHYSRPKPLSNLRLVNPRMNPNKTIDNSWLDRITPFVPPPQVFFQPSAETSTDDK